MDKQRTITLLLLYQMASLCTCIPQIEIQFSIMEEVHTPNTVIKKLTEDPAIKSQFLGRDIDKIYFQYLSEEPSGFAVSSQGDIRTTNWVDRDVMCPNKVTCVVTFDLVVQPEEYFTFVKITIQIQDINDHSPEFEREMELFIPESTQPGASYVLPKIVDPDSPMYSVDSVTLGGERSKFELRSSDKPDGSRELRLVLTAPLDREAAAEYRLPVTATDGGDPPRSGTLDITVLVTDANDNHPQFERDTYEVTLAENAAPGALVTTVHATDLDSGPNGRVLYRLSADTAAELGAVFSIHNVSGAVTVASAGGLDYEAAAILYLTVEAVDRGADPVPGEAVVIVHVEDVNDHAPAITVHTLGGPGVQHTAVTEGTQTGTFVARVVVTDQDDGDNGRYNCSLQSEQFALDPLGPDFLVTTRGEVDREIKSEYNLLVTCRDFGFIPLSSSAEISIKVADINDHAPYFEDSIYYRTAEENKIPGFIIIDLNATDYDEGINSEIVYSIEGQESQWFEIESESGILKTKRRLDRETKPHHQITIKASDKGDPVNSGIVVVELNVLDVNDELPIFTQVVYTFGIFENESPGSEVGVVQAEDKDNAPYNQFTFSLLSVEQGNMEEPFQIAPDTGRITTKRPLDRESQSMYSVTVLAVGSSAPFYTSTATVSIYVMDKNDNPPRFIFPSPENNTVYVSNDIPIGYIITRVQANDADGDVNGQIRYEIVGNASPQSTLFSLDPFLGTLTLVSTVTHLENKSFSLSVIATDNGDISMSTSMNLNIVVNKSRAAAGKLNGDGGIMSNVTIVIAVACLSGILIVGLLLAIVILFRQRRICTSHQWRHKRRTDTLHALTTTQPSNTCAGSERNFGKDTREDDQSCTREEPRYVPNNAQSRNPAGKTTELDLSLEKSRQWLDHLKVVSEKGDKSAVTKRDPDSESVSSGLGSNTDSGRGPSEQGDVGPRQHQEVTYNQHGSLPATTSQPQHGQKLNSGVVLIPDVHRHQRTFGRNSFHGAYRNSTNAASGVKYDTKRSSFHGNNHKSNRRHSNHHEVTRVNSYQLPDAKRLKVYQDQMNVDPRTPGSFSTTSSDSGNVPDLSHPPSVIGTPQRDNRAPVVPVRKPLNYAPIMYARCHGTLNKDSPGKHGVHKNNVNSVQYPYNHREYTQTGAHQTTPDDNISSSTSGSYEVDNDVIMMSHNVAGMPQMDVVV